MKNGKKQEKITNRLGATMRMTLKMGENMVSYTIGVQRMTHAGLRLKGGMYQPMMNGLN